MKNKFAKIILLIGVITVFLTACGKKENKIEGVSVENVKDKGKVVTVSNKAFEEKDDYTVNMRYSSSLCGAAAQIAYEKGFFEKYGVNVNMVKSSDASTADLIATNKIDAGQAMIPNATMKMENGLNVNMALGLHSGCFYILTAKDSNINDVSELKDKKIAVMGLGSDGAALVRRTLAAKGLNTSVDNMDFEFVVYPESEMAMALENNLVDAVAVEDPVAETLVDNGTAKILLSNASDEEFKDEACCSLMLRPDFVNEHPALAKKVVLAMKDSTNWIKDNPEETVEIQLSKNYIPNGDKNLYTRLISSYNWGLTVDEGRSSLKKNLKELQDLKVLKSETDIDKLLENNFVEFN